MSPLKSWKILSGRYLGPPGRFPSAVLIIALVEWATPFSSEQDNHFVLQPEARAIAYRGSFALLLAV